MPDVLVQQWVQLLHSDCKQGSVQPVYSNLHAGQQFSGIHYARAKIYEKNKLAFPLGYFSNGRSM